MVAKVTHRTVAINVTVIRDRLFRGLIYGGRWMLKCYSSFWISVNPLSSMCSEAFESVSMLTDVICVFPRCCFPSLILSLQFTLHLSWSCLGLGYHTFILLSCPQWQTNSWRGRTWSIDAATVEYDLIRLITGFSQYKLQHSQDNNVSVSC